MALASMASAGMTGGPAFDNAVLQDFFRGIQKYQSYPDLPPKPSLPVVATWGAASLLYCEPASNKAEGRMAPPVFMIPSMINGSDILDLQPDRSLVRYLAAQGHPVYLLDWGQGGAQNRSLDFDTLVKTVLYPAMDHIQGTASEKPVLLGYCMGGLFTAALLSLMPDLIAGAIFLAVPWDFHAGKAALKNRIDAMKGTAQPQLSQYGLLPESWTQALFASLDPEGTIQKFAAFARRADGEDRADLFVAVEDWLNHGRDLPGPIAHLCLDKWYGENRPCRKEWSVLGQLVDPGLFPGPSLVIAATQDKIVPLESALALPPVLKQAQTLTVETGHVGLIAAGKAVTDLWAPLSDWIALQHK